MKYLVAAACIVIAYLVLGVLLVRDIKKKVSNPNNKIE